MTIETRICARPLHKEVHQVHITTSPTTSLHHLTDHLTDRRTSNLPAPSRKAICTPHHPNLCTAIAQGGAPNTLLHPTDHFTSSPHRPLHRPSNVEPPSAVAKSKSAHFNQPYAHNQPSYYSTNLTAIGHFNKDQTAASHTSPSPSNSPTHLPPHPPHSFVYYSWCFAGT